MPPGTGRDGRQKVLALFARDDGELQRLVGSFRLRRAEDGDNSDAAFIAVDREHDNSISELDHLPEIEDVMPAAVAHALQQLSQARDAIGLSIRGDCGKHGIGMIPKSALTNGTAIENAAKFPGDDRLGRIVAIHGQSGHLRILVLLHNFLEEITGAPFVVGKQNLH